MTEASGEQLYWDLKAAARDAGKPFGRFVSPLFNGDSWKVEQLRMARCPKPQTVERVRALIAGEPLPDVIPSPRKGVPSGPRVRGDAEEGGGRITGEEIARRRALADLAHETRRPGETLQQAVRRLGEGN